MDSQTEHLLDRLPHRPPFRFITENIQIDDNSSGQAVWRVDGKEYFFAGHFPNTPIVPGVLIGEALAQLSGLIACAYHDSKHAPNDDAAILGKLAHIDLRFRDSVSPPSEIHLFSNTSRRFNHLTQYDVYATINENKIAHGTLTLSIPTLSTEVHNIPT